MARRNVLEFIVQAVDKASPTLDKIGAKFGTVAAKVAVAAIAIGVAIAATTAKMVTMAHQAAMATDAMGKLAAKAGANVEEFSRLTFAASRFGVTAEGVAGGLSRMTERIGDATNGIGAVAEAFQKLNISAHDLAQVSPEQQLLVIADAVGRLQTRAQKLNLMKDIFGGDADEFLLLFEKGAMGIRAMGRELDYFGGTVTANAAEISKKYTESLTNLNTAFRGLKSNLIESGLVEAMTDFYNAVARLVALTNSNSLASLDLQMKQLIHSLNTWRANMPRMSDEDFFNLPMVKKQQAEISELQKRIMSLNGSWESAAATAKVGLADITELAKEAFAPKERTGSLSSDNPLSSWIASMASDEVQLRWQLQNLRQAIVDGLVPDTAEQERLRQKIIDSFKLEELEQSAFAPKERSDTGVEMFDFMEQAAERAAQNMQDAFAEFFMNMDDGLKGLLQSFLNVMRRMLAEALAFRTMKILGVDSFFDKLAGRAGGGGVTAGTPYMVGERGPELFVPGSSGKIMPNSALGNTGSGGNYTTNIDARGADPGLIARLPAILEQRDRRLMMAVQRFAETGIMPT